MMQFHNSFKRRLNDDTYNLFLNLLNLFSNIEEAFYFFHEKMAGESWHIRSLQISKETSFKHLKKKNSLTFDQSVNDLRKRK